MAEDWAVYLQHLDSGAMAGLRHRVDSMCLLARGARTIVVLPNLVMLFLTRTAELSRPVSNVITCAGADRSRRAEVNRAGTRQLHALWTVDRRPW